MKRPAWPRLIKPAGWRRAWQRGEAVVFALEVPGPDAQTLLSAWRRDRRRPVALLEEQGEASTKRFSLIGGEPLFSLEGRRGRAWLVSGRRKRALGCSAQEGLKRISEGLVSAGLCAPKGVLCPMMGWLGYEAGRDFESIPQARPEPVQAPDWYFFMPQEWAAFDRSKGVWRFSLMITHAAWEKAMAASIGVAVPSNRRRQDPETRLRAWKHRVAGLVTAAALQPPVMKDGKRKTRAVPGKKRYVEMVRRARRYIAAGDVFQVNLSHRQSASFRGDPFDLYRRLSSINPSPFGAFVETAGVSIVSASPERLFKMKGRRVETWPIAGTHPRAKGAGKDKALELAMHASAKERAEHLMLVDLERNDLGRVCRAGSVRVTDFMVNQRYSHVQHLVSRVVGTLRPGLGLIDLLAAGFPGGTITGCPKIRCMEIIQELEKEERGLYTGSLGYWDPWHGRADFNILIRSLVVKQGKAWYQVGAGIVADSKPAHEWRETLHKAQAMRLALGQA